MGAKLNRLKDAQCGIVGVSNSAQAVGNKLTESADRSEKHEQVLVDLYQTMQKVTTELGKNREATLQTKQEIVLFNQKLQGEMRT